jgi:hypothetical protein
MQDPQAPKYEEATPEAIAAFVAKHTRVVTTKAENDPVVVTTIPKNGHLVVTTTPSNEPLVVTTNERVVTTQNDSVVVTTKTSPDQKEPVVVTTNRHGKYSGHRIMITVSDELYADLKAYANGRSVAAYLRGLAEQDQTRRNRQEF